MRSRQGVGLCVAVVLCFLLPTARSMADFYASCNGCTVGGGCTAADARPGTVVSALGSIPGPFCHVTGTPYMGGSAPTALGAATVGLDGSNNVVISNIGASGNDGASFPLTSTSGYGLFTPALPDLKTAGQVLKTSLRGMVNVVSNQLIGQYVIQGTGPSALLSADFSSIGSPSSSVQLFRNDGTLITSYVVANNTQLTITGSYMDFNRSVATTSAAAALNMPPSLVGVANFGFVADVSIQAPAAPVFPGVRSVVIRAQGITSTVQSATAFTIQAANVPSITVTSGVLGGGVQSVRTPALTEGGMAALTVLILMGGAALIMLRLRRTGSRDLDRGSLPAR